MQYVGSNLAASSLEDLTGKTFLGIWLLPIVKIFALLLLS